MGLETPETRDHRTGVYQAPPKIETKKGYIRRTNRPNASWGGPERVGVVRHGGLAQHRLVAPAEGDPQREVARLAEPQQCLRVPAEPEGRWDGAGVRQGTALGNLKCLPNME